MSGLLRFIGFVGVAIGLIALVNGSLPRLRLSSRKQAGGLLAASWLLVFAGAAMAQPSEDQSSPEASPSPALSAGGVASISSSSPLRPPGLPVDAREATITRNVDGDTVWAQGGTLPAGQEAKVRLLEFDAPEPNLCFGSQASQFAAAQLPVGSTVYLLADRGDLDRYGRYLRYLWKADGEFFNDMAVRQGYAKAVMIAPNDRFISQIRAAEAEAKAANRGLWGACGSTHPPAGAPKPTPSISATRTPSGQGPCSEAYPDFCIPPAPPDLDCPDIARNNFRVLAPDPHGFDGDHDGVGCESGGGAAIQPTEPPATEPPAPDSPEPAADQGNCSPSYPDFCIAPAPPDLNCADVNGTNFTVLPPDPHNFDRDHDGIGCES
jgi:micrococcal nuclease